jgi:hypothetical protein
VLAEDVGGAGGDEDQGQNRDSRLGEHEQFRPAGSGASCQWAERAGVGVGELGAIGVQAAPIWLDIVVTGLAIGSGTKPLHDLIKNIEKAKEGKEAAA